MIDIHNHLLSQVDDGSSSMEESVLLLEEAERDGITDIILTPHYMHHGEARMKAEELRQKYEAFCEKCVEQGITIRFHLGNELYIDSRLDEFLEEQQVLSLADSNYVLVEFPFTAYHEVYDDYLYNMRIAGYRIIIAHPERYAYVRERADFVNRWLKEGYLLQLNQSAFFHKETRKLADGLLRKGKISFVATDSHNCARPCKLSPAYEYVSKEYGVAVANRLFLENPLCVLNNEVVEAMPVIPEKHWIFG